MAYVDDLSQFGDDGLIFSVKKGIEKYFRVTDRGSLTQILCVKHIYWKRDPRVGSNAADQKES